MAVALGYQNVFRDPHGYPQWHQQGLPTAGPALKPQITPPPSVPPETKRSLHGWALLWTLAGVFGGGLALNLTPCVYPMIPITVSFFGGRSASHKPRQIVLVVHGLCYLTGLVLTNSMLGVAAALTGGLMGALLQNPMVLTLVAGILLILASSLFGLWELRLPAGLTRIAGKSHGGFWGSLFMGIAMGVVAAPCIGPFVLGLFTWVAGTGDAWFGLLIFFVLSLGLGLPLFVLALFSSQLQRLPRAGAWMLWVRKVMGWVLVGMAVYFLRPVLPEIFKVMLPAGIAVAAGLHLGWLEKHPQALRMFSGLKTLVGGICLVMAAFWVSSWAMQPPGVVWQPYSEQLLEQASSQGRPVIIDFYADWCAPCRELESITFHHPDVVQLSRQAFTMIKVDVTQGDNPLHERLLSQYNVKGVPTVVFLDAGGIERTDLRLVDFMAPEAFLHHLAQLKGRGKK